MSSASAYYSQEQPAKAKASSGKRQYNNASFYKIYTEADSNTQKFMRLYETELKSWEMEM